MYDKDKILQAIWDNPTPITGLYFELHGQQQCSCQRLNGAETARPDRTTLKWYKGEIMVHYNGDGFRKDQSIWDFIKWRYSVDKDEMYKVAAEAYGIQGDLSELPEERRRAIAKRAEDATIIAEIAKYLAAQLHTEAGAATRDYLRGRGLEPTERLGAYSKKIRAGLLKYLTDGFRTIPASTMDEKLNEQLTRWNADDYGLVIPYYNGHKCIGFCLRRTTQETTYKGKDGSEREKPKYLFSLNTNSGGSFEKQGYCGNLNPDKPVILVEGALDAERCRQSGFDNVMALGGKTPTDGEVNTLLRHGVKSIIQVPDYEFDKDGQLNEAEAVGGTIKKIIPQLTGDMYGAGFISYKIARLHNAGGQDKTKQDADSFIREYGADAFGYALDKAQRWYDWQFEEAAKHYGGEELAARAVQIYCSAKSEIDKSNIKQSLQGKPAGVYAKLKAAGVDTALLKQIDARGRATSYREDIEAIATELGEAVKRSDTADNIAKILHKATRLQSSGGQSRLAAQINATRYYYETLVRNKPDELTTDWALYNDEGRKIRNISFPVGYYSVIAAPTGYGKTAFLMRTAIDLARRLRKVFIFVSMEEDEEQLYIRSMAAYMGEYMPSGSGAWKEWRADNDEEGGYINPKGELRRNIKQPSFKEQIEFPDLPDDLPSGNEQPSTEELIEKYTQKYWAEVAPYLKLYRSESGEVQELCDNITAVVEDLQASGVEVGGIIFDYIQLMRTAEAKSNRSEELGAVCTRLNSFAKELQVAILVGGQTNRKATEQGKQSIGIDGITLSNLGDSTGIERTAAEVYLLLRPDRGLIKQSEVRDKNIEQESSDRTRRCLQYASDGSTEIKPSRLYIENLKARNYAPDGYATIRWDSPTGWICSKSDKPE